MDKVSFFLGGLIVGVILGVVATTTFPVYPESVEFESDFEHGTHCFEWFTGGYAAGESNANLENLAKNSQEYLEDLDYHIELYDRINSCKELLSESGESDKQ